MIEIYVLTINADNKAGLVHLIVGTINGRLLDIERINATKTGVSSFVVITIELFVSKKALQPLLFKFNYIIEVYGTNAIKASECLAIRSAYFKLSKCFLETPKSMVLQKFGANIVNLHPDPILVSKSGCDADQLEGPNLLGFNQTGLIAATYLFDNDESSVISWAA